MQDSAANPSANPPQEEFQLLVEAIVKAVLSVQQSDTPEDALLIRDQLQRLPSPLMTEVLNQVILRLIKIDPVLCRWFIIDIFLRDANPEGKADVAERLNLLLADLQSS